MSFHSKFACAASAAVLLLLAPTTACAQIATPVVTSVEGAQAEFPFELFRGTRVIVEGQINGVKTPMILDSGAGVTTIDKGFARKIGIKKGIRVEAQGAGGSQEAELVQGVTIAVGNLQLSGVSAAVIELDAIEKGIGRPIPVILGRELFTNSIVDIDFDRKMIALFSPETFVEPAGAREIRLKRDGTLHYLPLSINGLPAVEAAFDLGNGGALSISKEYLEATPALGELPFALGFGGGVGGFHEEKRVTLPKVELGGFSFASVPADLGSLPDGPYARRVNAGIQLFKPFRLTMDLGRDRLWLRKGKTDQGFAKDRAGLFVMLEGDHFDVLHVSPTSPAAKAGFKKGDRIVAIAGRPVDSTFYSSPQAEWAKGRPGTSVTLRKEGGEEVALTLADYY